VPVFDPEKILKPRGLFKQNVVIYQPNSTQSKYKTFLEPSSSQEPSLRKKLNNTVEVETLKFEQILPEIKTETSPINSYISRGDMPSIKLILIDIPSNLNINLFVTQGLEEVSTPMNLTPVGSPIYISYKSKEPSPHSPSPPFPTFTSPGKKFHDFFPLDPKEVRAPLYMFANPLYNTPISSPRSSMAATRGGAEGERGQGQQPPPRVFTNVAAKYAPLVLPVPLHDLPENYMKNLPKFIGEGDLTTTEHINLFNQLADILGLQHEDVYSHLFVQTFEGQVRTWFQNLPPGSILSYDALEDLFIKQWGERKDHLYYLIEFGTLRKKGFETVMEFIQRFNKLYNKIPVEVKPSQPAAKVTFTGDFEPDFSLLLRERRGADLTQIQDDTVEIKSNMMASGKLKTKIETGNRETKCFREQACPFGFGRSSDDKMDDMARIIKELSNKISRMELDQSKSDQFIKREFRRNPNPQIQQRQIKNEDQKIQTPLKNESFIGGNYMQEFEDLEEDVKNLGDDCIQSHLTKEDYEKYLDVGQPSGPDSFLNNANDISYQGMDDTIMAEL
jgi:hypothetical protein